MKAPRETSPDHPKAGAHAGKDAAAGPAPTPLNSFLAARGLTYDAMGNRGLLALLRSGQLQRKARVSQPGSPLEHEADSAADRVMRMTAFQADEGVGPAPGRTSEHESAQTPQPTSGGIPPAAAGETPGIVGEVLGASGQPLDAETRAFFEPRFGQDFSDVRIHSGARAADSARAIAASAYTSGSQIVFAHDEHRPHTTEGRKLLAHELAHVVQQAEGRAAGIQRQPIPIVESERPANNAVSGGIGSEQIVDPFITLTNETITLNQDEGFNEHLKSEYGEGWIKIGGGKERKVKFATETLRHEDYVTQENWTTKNTTWFWDEYQIRDERSPLHFEMKEQLETKTIVSIPKAPVKKKSSGIWSKVGGFFKGLGKSLWGLAESLYHVVRHPIQTLKGLYNIVRHPIRTLKALGHAIVTRGEAILSGDTEALGQTVGDIAIIFLAPEAEAAEGAEAIKAIDASKTLDAAKALDTEASLTKGAADLEGAAATEKKIAGGATEAPALEEVDEAKQLAEDLQEHVNQIAEGQGPVKGQNLGGFQQATDALETTNSRQAAYGPGTGNGSRSPPESFG